MKRAKILPCIFDEVMGMRAISLVSILVVAALLVTTGGYAQVKAESSASVTGSSGRSAEATIGTFVFEQGQALSVEIMREEPCPCLCDPLYVTGFCVLNEEGQTIFTGEELVEQSYPYDQWVGLWSFADLDVGVYTVVVSTNIGEFRARVELVPPEAASLSGRVSSEASVCGVGLRLYRVVDETNNGQTVSLNEGERLMVALSGNVTTGYEWEVEEAPDGSVLEFVEGVDYLSFSSLLGAPGTFLFRYEAKTTGRGNLSLRYHRPWESVPPLQTFSVFIAVL
jgi:inhibitor of cysteine peptidase